MFEHALTIQQPWLDRIFFEGKRLENRTWKPPKKHIGSYILLHASKKIDRKEGRGLGLMTGAILGYARIKGFIYPDGVGLVLTPITMKDGTVVQEPRISLMPPELYDFSNRDERGLATMNRWWIRGSYALILDEVETFRTPIPCKGTLRFWKVPEEVQQIARNQFIPF